MLQTDSNQSKETKFDNFFVLFEQPMQFELSQAALDSRLRQLQKRYHPDNADKESSENNAIALTNNSEFSSVSTEQLSALINQAYQTLSNLDSRASYLLDLANQAQTLDQSIADLDFLDDAMQLRMDLDDAITDNHNSALQHLHVQVDERLASQSKRFTAAYQQQEWSNAIDATQKLKFLVKLSADIALGLDELASTEQSDDDDLYV